MITWTGNGTRLPIGYDPDRHRTDARLRLVYGARRSASRELIGAIPDDLPRVPPVAPITVRAAHWLRDGTPPGWFKVAAVVGSLAVWALAWALMYRAF